jgi:hypothetical protein
MDDREGRNREDNIKVDLRDVGSKDLMWMELTVAPNTVQ